MAHGVIKTDQAPAAIGPYSQGVISGNLIFCSGQIPLQPNGELVASSIKAQTRQALDNLTAVIIAGGSSLTQVVKTSIYLTDLNDFSVVNEIYAEYFQEPFPARATVQVSGLPKGVLIEIDAICVL